MHRFFVQERDGNYFNLDESVKKHIKVARLDKEIFLCNYQNNFYECVLENQKAKILKERFDINNEFKKEVILAAPIIKMNRFEWLIEKATELGVTKIIPLITKFTDGSLVKYDLARKYERHCEIVKNAAEQSFRNIIPQFLKPTKLENLINEHQNKNIFLAYENANSSVVKELPTNSLIIVGPEGGFSQEEISYAQENNVKIISLGKTILRAETACLYVLSNIKE
ncbi:16S rRNA (uracil(1498)-N(3))-methyltransferase [Mycoplasmopsis columbina]|uniref:Ribosomal RNA small subunit methyltransferase E n=1 Tax=Mycoplasmopsis columbina SF7 TaxID=1037410 RepID=F9UK48_9BACT|nr:16S rRNA (uracil(1498)-N(3))-methyltransferase [Mycoplasmopsis columbina]EGV00053.1 16S ribosomal RNA methyltransferase RsmE [Mycoplasmopsis columbina SF7]VEU76949.1 RsmE family RNA methyltransferase [Mycoplasmopsis columbina]